MGKPDTVNLYHAQAWEPRELKHLSSARKRDDSVSSGERTRSSPNQVDNDLGL